MQNNNKLQTLVNRLNKIGVHIELMSDTPYIYLRKINGKIVREKLDPNYKVIIGKYNNNIELTNISKLFEVIRKYVC